MERRICVYPDDGGAFAWARGALLASTEGAARVSFASLLVDATAFLGVVVSRTEGFP